MIEKQPRIALLIDADNSPSSKIDVILAELAKVGVANIRRAYGNWKKDGLKGWEGVLHEYAIRPIQQFDYSKGKNATDMGMVIDAMDLLYTDEPDAFGIVSSDSDFTPLVMHLKAKGAQVFGFGAKKTPMPFVNACSRFLYLENLGRSVAAAEARAEPAAAPRQPARTNRGAGAAPVAVSGPPPAASDAPATEAAAESAPLRLDSVALRRDARLVTLLRNAVETAAGEDGWSALGAVGQQIGNQASFDPRNYGYRKLIDLIDASQLFDLDRRGSQVVLRDKRLVKAVGADRPVGAERSAGIDRIGGADRAGVVERPGPADGTGAGAPGRARPTRRGARARPAAASDESAPADDGSPAPKNEGDR